MDIYGHGAPHLPIEWLGWLAVSDVRMAMYGNLALFGVLRFLHLVGVAGFFGSVLLVDAKLVGLFRNASLQSVRDPLVAIMHWSFGLAILAGIGIFMYDPLEAGLHTMFLPKMLLILLGLAHAHGLRRIPATRTWVPLQRGAAAASLVIWLLVIACAVWNHVERPLNPADIHRAEHSRS